MEEYDEVSIQFGIQLDEDDSPVVVLIFPEIEDPDTADYLTISIGGPSDVAVFTTQLLRAGQFALELSEELAGVEDRDRMSEIISNYGKRMNSPYN